jgi:hypothetical protein
MKRSRPNCAAHLGREARSETQRPAPWRREAFGFHIEADGSLTEHEGEQAVIRKAQCGGAGSGARRRVEDSLHPERTGLGGPEMRGRRPRDGPGFRSTCRADRCECYRNKRKFIISATPPAGDVFLPDAMVGSRPYPGVSATLRIAPSLMPAILSRSRTTEACAAR